MHDAGAAGGDPGRETVLAPAVHGAPVVGWPMDFLFVVATVAFFAVSIAYVRGCDRL